MDKRFLAILAVLVIVFGGIFVFSQNSTNKSKTGSSSPPSNHVLGEKTKNVTLVEYGDFQCQACLAYEPVIQQVRTVYAKDLHFQFRHCLLPQSTPMPLPLPGQLRLLPFRTNSGRCTTCYITVLIGRVGLLHPAPVTSSMLTLSS